LTTLTFNASATYRVPKYLFGIDLSANSTDQESGNTSRENLSFRFQQFFKKRWFAGWELTGEKNSELGIDLRTVLSGTAGRNVIQTNSMILAAGTGLSYNRERLFDETTGASEERDGLEALGQLRWEVFHDRNPETDVVSELSIYPSITDWGRLRADLEFTLRHELFKDFFWQLHLRETYDNRPPSEDVSKGDLVGDTSFGWSF